MAHATMAELREAQQRVRELERDYAALATAARLGLAAVKAYDLLDDKHANCSQCEGLEVPEACCTCFPFADDCRLKQRAALTALDAILPPEGAAKP